MGDIKAVFTTGGDGVCIAHNRSAGAGEYVIKTKPTEWVAGWNPKFYKDVDGVFTVRDQNEIDAVIASETQTLSNVVARLRAIEQARTAQGLKGITLEQANTYMKTMLDTSGMSLDDYDAAASEIDNIVDLASARAVIRGLALANRALFIIIYQHLNKNREVHLREIPYIIM